MLLMKCVRRARLAPAAAVPAAAVPAQDAPGYAFTAEQLDQYGIDELQVLEDLLRRADHPREREVLEAVTRRVRDKIGWTDEVPSGEVVRFLNEFYRQLRAQLEHKALFGVRQQRKKAGKLGRPDAQGPAGPPPTE